MWKWKGIGLKCNSFPERRIYDSFMSDYSVTSSKKANAHWLLLQPSGTSVKCTDCLNSLAVTQPEMWSTLWLADSNITETTHHAGANFWRLLWFHTWRIKHACVNFEIASLLTKELIIAGLSAQKRNAVELHSKMGLNFLVVVTCEQLGELY